MNKRDVLLEGNQILVKVLEGFRSILFVAGFIGLILGICCIDTEGPAFMYIILEVGISLLLLVSAAAIEYFMFDYLVDSEYFEWLDENDLDDTEENYRYYQDLVA